MFLAIGAIASGAWSKPVNRGNAKRTLYLWIGLGVFFAISWLIARTAGLGANIKVRKAAFLVLGMCFAYLAVNGIVNRSGMWIGPAIASVYFLFLWGRGIGSDK